MQIVKDKKFENMFRDLENDQEYIAELNSLLYTEHVICLIEDKLRSEMQKHTRQHRHHYGYVIVKEWHYPNSKNIDVLPEVFFNTGDAFAKCKEICESEVNSYASACGDPLNPEMFVPGTKGPNGRARGYIITAKNGVDPWWFAARFVKIRYGIDFADKGDKNGK